MLDTTPVSTAISKLISTGMTEQALLAAVAQSAEPDGGRSMVAAERKLTRQH